MNIIIIIYPMALVKNKMVPKHYIYNIKGTQTQYSEKVIHYNTNSIQCLTLL